MILKASEMTPVQMADLYDTAERAWAEAPPRMRRVPFEWRGRHYVAHRSASCLMIGTPGGTPLVCRYD